MIQLCKYLTIKYKLIISIYISIIINVVNIYICLIIVIIISDQITDVTEI
jgi:hypothetical protein